MSSNSHSNTLISGQNLVVTGGRFELNVNPHCHLNNPEPGARSSIPMASYPLRDFIGLEILHRNASLSAAHDASARDPPPRCAPGTREMVIADIMRWITDSSSTTSILWLNGPFGNGKSAIMQTIADRLHGSNSQLHHHLAGSFFFGRGKPGRDKATYLVPTIAYQVAINIPSMRKPIDMAVIQDPTIFSKTIGVQLRHLITNPFHQVTCGATTPFDWPTVIIDGLDECDGHDSQRCILDAISTAVFKDHIPLRFLIASRPERQISQTFYSQPLDHHHYPMTLTDDYHTRKELEQFLRSGFDKIHEQQCDVMATVERPWPSKQDLEDLVYRASGQFLYASTVLKFVDSDMANPVHQLNLILRRQGCMAAFSTMDELYTQILELCLDQGNLPSFLRSVFTLNESGSMSDSRYYARPTLANHAFISGLQPDDISFILRWLPAVIEVKLPRQQDLPDGYPLQEFMRYYSPDLSVHHKSFIEFLADKNRSGKFYIDPDIAYQEMMTRLDVLISTCLSAWYD